MWNAEKSHSRITQNRPEGIRPHYRSLKVLREGCCALFSH